MGKTRRDTAPPLTPDRNAGGLFLQSAGHRTATDRSFLELAVAFANGRTGRRLSNPPGRAFKAWSTQESDLPYLEEWRRRGGTTTREMMPSMGALAEERRVQLSDLFGEYVEDRRAMRERFAREFAPALAFVVIRPMWQIRTRGIVRRDELWAFTWPEVLAYLVLLLVDESQDFGRELYRCQLASCGRFFIAERVGKGRPRSKYHSNDCMTAAHDARQR
jgi:hypothetical protein